ncbi:hypothetical protein PGJ_00006230 [Porphyromonas gingivalis AJW4]|uniref:Uncharacterized protein n=2 Tax=Porphyromonas gingivalis TaxID=837 RepID=B2RKK9_PORG3|nr:hypothetical protein PGA7_00007450 [Porphyromonas gingivalis]ALA93243.1 hypothetical protein PGJ_00006230 [Porphyromonas gingivalis AJW4]ALJ25822.1 hypothetical protein PGF_00013860 [Porphyromonas gingivalis 381]ALO29417.1 hypothetical protein PGS_00006740 [Porphyromonas gingivalis A7A1-28]AUR50676.1 membrane protein involved in tellurium resistance [Porphyromonas gingivalis ATCC 33277]EOA11224.1 hypothetical protein A343_1917 [Porphyromonas gingivalis JCVI SC001]ERJ66962.1 hypothetical pr
MNLSCNNFCIRQIIVLFAEIKTKTNKTNILTMEGIGKYLGAIILLVGVLVLAIPAFTNSISDKSLMIGLFLVVVGFFAHIILGRRAKA